MLTILLGFTVAFGLTWRLCTHGTGGATTYTLDDAYIHLAYAQNLLRHHLWGVTSHEFASASSSPLWVLLLAAGSSIWRMGSNLPLFLNWVGSLSILVVVARMLRAEGYEGRWLAAAVGSFAVLTCLVPLALSGMEHVAQILVTILFLNQSTVLLESAGRPAGDSERVVRCVVLGGLATALRYDDVWLVGVIVILCLLRGRFAVAALLVAAGLAPIATLGLLSMAHGWPFLPTALLLKANGFPHTPTGWIATVALGGLPQLLDMLPLAFLVLACAALFLLRSRRHPFWERRQLMLAICVVTPWIHARFTSVSWYMRYEAYLIASSLLALLAAGGPELRSVGPRRIGNWLASSPTRLAGVGFLALIPLFPLSSRALRSWASLPAACRNIHEQQLQIGAFCREHFAGAGIAANDIGAVSYLADPHLLDIWGLGSVAVCRARQATGTRPPGWPGIHFLHDQVVQRNIAAIIAYDRVLARYGDPRSVGWVRVGSWTIRDNQVCAQDEVSFYAPDSSRVRALTDALVRFGPRLPASVRQQGVWQTELDCQQRGPNGSSRVGIVSRSLLQERRSTGG